MGRASYWAFVACVVLTVVFMLGVVTVQSDAGWLTVTRLVLGGALILEGFLLLEDWRGARALLLRRLRERHGERTGRSLLWATTGRALGVLGLIWICMGGFSLALGLSGLV